MARGLGSGGSAYLLRAAAGAHAQGRPGSSAANSARPARRPRPAARSLSQFVGPLPTAWRGFKTLAASYFPGALKGPRSPANDTCARPPHLEANMHTPAPQTPPAFPKRQHPTTCSHGPWACARAPVPLVRTSTRAARGPRRRAVRHQARGADAGGAAWPAVCRHGPGRPVRAAVGRSGAACPGARCAAGGRAPRAWLRDVRGSAGQTGSSAPRHRPLGWALSLFSCHGSTCRGLACGCGCALAARD
jgi:hypothetical protein